MAERMSKGKQSPAGKATTIKDNEPEWHETEFYEGMTEFYRSPTRKRLETKPSVELRSCRKIGSFALTEMQSYGS